MRTITRNDQRAPNWRTVATPDDLREYDAFGPWIEKVASRERMPPRFRAFYDEVSSARLVLKFPRPVDRASVLPGQDLYAAVLAIHTDRLILLELPPQAGDPVLRREVALKDVVAVASRVNLLLGTWSLLLRDGSRVDLDHSTVSRRRIDTATDLVRDLSGGAAASAEPAWIGEPVTLADTAFSNAVLQLASRCAPPVVPVHAEPRNSLRRNERGRFVLTSGLLLVDTRDELVIIEGTRSRHAGHAWTTTFVRYHALTSFAMEVPTRPRQLHALVLVAGDGVIRVPCTSRPEAVLAALAARGIPRSEAPSVASVPGRS